MMQMQPLIIFFAFWDDWLNCPDDSLSLKEIQIRINGIVIGSKIIENETCNSV